LPGIGAPDGALLYFPDPGQESRTTMRHREHQSLATPVALSMSVLSMLVVQS